MVRKWGLVERERTLDKLSALISPQPPKHTLKKRGQITAFIIVGVLLLLIIGAVFYLKFLQAEKELPTAEFEFSKEPVTAYLQSCMKGVSEEALQNMGVQGGYITVNADPAVAQLDPFNADFLTLDNGKLNLPYWYYQRRDGQERVNIPKLYKSYRGDFSIQDQLETSIKEHIAECVTDFSAFEKQGIAIVQQSQPEIAVNILDTAVEVQLSMPLEIQKLDTTETLETVTITLPVALKKVYELAYDITKHELNTLFFERATLNLITAYSGVDETLLPPIAGGLIFESCANRKFWFSNNVEDNVKTMLAANIPYIKVANTNYEEIIIKDRFIATKEEKIRQGVFDHLTAVVSDKTYHGVSTQIFYEPTYPLLLEFGNGQKGFLEPQMLEVNFIIAQLCMFDYSYLYNLKFPVLITIVDEQSSINNQPYLFQFPLQVVVKNNFPRIKLNDVLQGELPELYERDSFQCAPEQRMSKESSVTLKDTSGKPINGATVYFQCGPSIVTANQPDEQTNLTPTLPFSETCFMGTTTSGVLKEKYPPCKGGGLITVKHPNYLEKSLVVGDVTKQQGFTQDITLDRVYEKKVKVRKYFVKPPAPQGSNITIENPGIVVDAQGTVSECNLYMEQKPLQPYESAIITLTKLDPENGILPAMPVALVEGERDETIAGTIAGSNEEESPEATLKIAPGKYTVDVMLVREERYPGELTIRKESQALVVPQGVLGAEKTIRYPDEDILVEQIFAGGSELVWEVTDEELKNKEAILFYVIDEGEPKRIEEIGTALQHRAGCAALNYNVLEPKLV